MTELIDIIIQAVDDATATFESIINTANESGSTLQSAFEEATAEVERLKEELQFAEDYGYWDEIDTLTEQLSEAEA